VAEAVARAASLEALEERLGVFVELDVQRWMLDYGWLTQLANVTYIWGHWPVIGLVGVYLYLAHTGRYRVYRNTMLLSGAVGVVCFVLLPTAPPRLANPEFLDTIVQQTDAYRVMQPPALTNQYAAIPSLHFGWNLLMGIALVRETRHPLLRGFGWLMPVPMAFATIATANHYVLDVLVGGALVVAALIAIEALGWRRMGRAERSVGAGARGLTRSSGARIVGGG
jgi:hypothetical protein